MKKKNNKDENLVAYQVFLITVDNANIDKFIDVLDEMGDYLTVNKKDKGFAVVNTAIKANKMAKMFDRVKDESDKISIVGMTFNMIDSFNDKEIKNWCLAKQFQNMSETISLTQKNVLQDIDSIFDKLEIELKKKESGKEKID